MKWFKHDTTALHDAKIEKLTMKYGIQGYGVYFACVEIIAGTIAPDNFTFELEHDAEILAYKFKVDTLLIEEIMRYCVDLGLFELSKDNRITCLKLAQRLDNTMVQNKELKETLSNFNSLKAEEKRREENRTEDKSVVDVYLEEYPKDFEAFCVAYPKHVEKARAYPQYQHLIKTLVDPELITKSAENYATHCKLEKTEAKYIKQAHNFLKDSWRDYLTYKAPKAQGAVTMKVCPKCNKKVSVLTDGMCHDCLRAELRGDE